MSHKIELKPCPFCGGEAEIYKDNYDKYIVICSCGTMIGVELEDGIKLVNGWIATFETANEAAEAWNRRCGNENEPVKSGRWIEKKKKTDFEGLYEQSYACSCCGNVVYGKYNYCCDCGARMDGGESNDD